MEVKGRIESFEEKQTKDGKPYVKVKIDGKTYNCFNADVTQGVRPGDDVKVTYLEKTVNDMVFKNIMAMEKLNQELKVEEETVAEEKKYTNSAKEYRAEQESFENKRRHAILLGQCANWAANYLISIKPGEDEFIKKVPVLARKLMDECMQSGVFGF